MTEISNQEVRNIQIEILDSIHAFCSNNNIKYSLCGGTLLGAVRHNGYIPWDDDIDLMMHRADYTRFVTEYKDTRFEALSIETTKGYDYPFCKVSDTETILKEDANIKATLGVNVDILPIDTFPTSEEESIALVTRIKGFRLISDLKRLRASAMKRAWYKLLALNVAKLFLWIVSNNAISRRITQIAQSHQSDNPTHVGIIVWGYGMKERCKNQGFHQYVDIAFEGKNYKAISCYKQYLTTVYGNYMQLPPEEKRTSYHLFKAYRKR